MVIPALVAHGYDLEDARDYTVAACWEFIIPGKGMEIVNIGAVSMPAAADRGIRRGLAAGEDMTAILEHVRANMAGQVENLVSAYRRLLLPPAPYYSVLMDGCLESGRDLSHGLKYNNFGIHGACSANAADALAAVEQFVFEEKSVSAEELLEALDANFSNRTSLQRKLKEAGRKSATTTAGPIECSPPSSIGSPTFAMRRADNGRGGIVRPGTGSAMYYVWLAEGHEGMREPSVGATADGRMAGEYFSASLAPGQGVQVRGPFSVLQSLSASSTTGES